MTKTLRNKLNDSGIAVVYIFGSSATGLKHKKSDIDIGIVFENGVPPSPLVTYTKLYELFSEIFPAKEIDIVFLEDAPLSLQFEAIKYGKVLYEKDTNLRLDYEEKTMLKYADFLPLEEEMERTILERI
jgi:predicted nucleotidyltransferase